MTSFGWKTRSAIVLSSIWIVIVFSIAFSEENSLAILGFLGIFPLATLWGIVWIWAGFRKQRLARSPKEISFSNQFEKTESSIEPTLNKSPEVSLRSSVSSQPLPRAGNRWLSIGFIVTSLLAFALYFGLLIHAVVKNGDAAYALGAMLIPTLITYVAISNRNNHSNKFGLLAGIAITFVIFLGGANIWKSIFLSQEIAEVAQKHLDDTRRLLEPSTKPITSDSGNKAKLEIPPTNISPSRELTKTEELEFFNVFLKDAVKRQEQYNQTYLAELSKLQIDAMWEPANLFSLRGLKENQRKVAAYRYLIEKMKVDADNETSFQENRVFSVAGPKALESFRIGAAKNRQDQEALFALEFSNVENFKRLFSFLENQLTQGTAAFHDGQPLFSTQADLEVYNSLMSQVINTQKKIEDLQKESILRRQMSIDKIKASGGRN